MQSNASLGAAALFEEECDSLLDSNLVKIIKTIAYSLLLVTILVGNSLVIAVTCRNRNLQKTINFLILNMALSDLFVPLFGLPIRIEQIYLPQGRWLVGGAFGSITCKILPFAHRRLPHSLRFNTGSYRDRKVSRCCLPFTEPYHRQTHKMRCRHCPYLGYGSCISFLKFLQVQDNR